MSGEGPKLSYGAEILWELGKETRWARVLCYEGGDVVGVNDGFTCLTAGTPVSLGGIQVKVWPVQS